jgi:hypothetical protein
MRDCFQQKNLLLPLSGQLIVISRPNGDAFAASWGGSGSPQVGQVQIPKNIFMDGVSNHG